MWMCCVGVTVLPGKMQANLHTLRELDDKRNSALPHELPGRC
jgi:hypothetical protein